MKNNYRLLRVLGDVRDDLIPDAESKKKKSKAPLKWAAAGTVTAAAAAAVFFALQNTGSVVDLTGDDWEDHRIYKEISFSAPSSELPEIARGSLEGNGLPVSLYHDISEYGRSGLWSEETELSSLPVFKNLAYNGYMIPSYFDEAEMLKMAENAAHALGISVIEHEAQYYGKNEDVLYGLKAVCSGEALGLERAEISVESGGEIKIDLSFPSLDDENVFGIAIPEGYVFETVGGEKAEAEKTVNYLAERFKSLLQFDSPESDVYNSGYQCDAAGSGYYLSFGVYDRSGSLSESILNRELARAVFSCYESGRLNAIYLYNELSCAKYLGDYPVISLEEAKDKLTDGEFLSVFSTDDTASGSLEEDSIVNTELVYLNYRQEYLQPYYKFTAELKSEPFGNEYDGSLKPYGDFYVYAVEDEYFVEDGGEDKGDTEEELQSIRFTLSEYPFDYTLTEHFGNGIRAAEDISALEDLNPWSKELKIDSLPVYEMFGLSEAQMKELAESTAEKMGVAVKDMSFVKNHYPNSDGAPYRVLMAFCEGEYHGISDITLEVYGTGDVEVYFARDKGENFFDLPAEYSDGSLTDHSTAARAGLEYLAYEFNDLLRFESPVLNSYVGSRSLIYDQEKDLDSYKYRVYEDSENIAEKILNYSLAYAEFDRSDSRIIGITLTDKLFASEKIGDYPVMTAEEAKELLLDGKYLIPFSKDYVKDGGPTEEDIEKVELVYRVSESKYLVPCYCFYARINGPVPILERYGGLKEYGEFYVPAIRTEYIAGDPYAAQREQAVIDACNVEEVPLPDGSRVGPDEASETFGDKIVYDFAYLRYAKPIFFNTIDEPEIFDFDTYSFLVPDDETLHVGYGYFKVEAGDVLENGLTVKSASLGYERGEYTSRIVLKGEITLEGILSRRNGMIEFYPDPSKNAVPMIFAEGSELSEAVLPNYYTDLDNFALVSGAEKIYPSNDIYAEDIFKSADYVKGSLTLRDMTLLVSDWEDMVAAGIVFDQFETAEFVSFKTESRN
ncbi:MAG: hypothetical protein NC394_08195 [Bacteroides sp.]|nr:hypothetical protein [Bacteroides sp.]